MSEPRHIQVQPLGGSEAASAREQELQVEVAKLRHQNSVLAKACQIAVRYVPQKYSFARNTCRNALRACGLPEVQS